MNPSIQKKFTALVISLAIQVISLTGIASAASFSGSSVLAPVTDQVSAPYRIAVDQTTGYFYVTDSRAGGVLVYSKYGVYVKTITTASTPKGVAFFGGNGTGAGKIVVTQGAFAAVYDVTTGLENTALRMGVGALKNADGVAVDSSGYFWIADPGNQAVMIYGPTGGTTAVAQYPGIGSVPVDVKLVTTGGVTRMFMVDMANSSGTAAVASYTVSGTNITFEKSVPLNVSSPAIVTPMGLAVETSADGLSVRRLYVVDALEGNVQVVDFATVTSLGSIGSYGSANGKLMVPEGVELSVVGTNKILLVANGYGNVTSYGIDGGTWPPITGLPQVTVVPPGTVLTPSFTLNGTVTNAPFACTVHLVEANLDFAATVVGSTWSAPLSGYGFGTNNFNVTCRNAAGSGAVSDRFTYSADNGITFQPALPQYTNKSKLLVSGTNATNATVRVTNPAAGFDSATNGSVSQTDANHWSCLVDIAPGANTITATATNPNSTPSTNSVSATVTYDNVPPTLNVSTLTSGDATSGQLLNVSGSASDDTGTAVTVAVIVNGASAVPATLYNGGVFNVPVVLANGSNEIDVMATDVAGNTTTVTRVITFDFDRTRPVITVNQSDVVDTDVSTLTLSGSVTNAVTLTVAGTPVTIDASNNWTTSTPITLASGTNTIEIVATSLTGKTSSVKRTVTYNSTKPALALTIPSQDFAINVPSKDVSGTVGSAAAGVKCYFNNTTITPVVTAGAFTFNVPIPTPGSWNLNCTAVDGLNTVLSSLTRSLVYINTAPGLTVDTTTSAAPVTVTGTVDAGGKVKVEARNTGGVPVGTTTLSNSAGTYSIDLTGVTYDPTALLICGVDVASNSTCKPLVPIQKDCDYNGDGVTTIMDALLMQRDVINGVTPTPIQLAHADVAPLRLGAMNPNGVLDMSDVLVCMKVATGTVIPGIIAK
jgi:hypothetical protein